MRVVKSLVVLMVPAFLLAGQAMAQETAPGQGLKRMTMEESLLLPSWGSYSLSPDNSKVVFTKREMDQEDWESVTHVWIHEIASGESYQLTNSVNGDSSPRWLPDGRVMFTSRRGDGDDAENRLWVISTTGGEARPYFEDDEAPSSGDFTEDYGRVAYTEESDRPDKEEWEEREEEKDDAFYAEKKLTYNHIWVYDAETGEKTQVTSGEFDHQGPQWSPDGGWIAYTSNRTQTQMGDEDRSDNSDILVIPAAGGEARNLTSFNDGPDRGPVWSPEGDRIAFTGGLTENSGAGQNDLFVVGLDGGAPHNLTENLDYSVSGAQWSVDGEYIYFSAAQDRSARFYRINASGGEAETVLPGGEFVYGGAQLSEDGSTLLFTGSSLAVPGEVFLAGADGSNIRKVMSPTNQMEDFELARAVLLDWEGPGGLEIQGILTYPLGYVEGTRYPTILQVHGGPHGRFSKTFNSSAQIWAAKGYAVLQGNPRGSSGRTLAFSNANDMDWGGDDYRDLMAGVDLAIEMGVADSEKLAIMGGSYGGFMTFWAITQTDRFKAAIGHAAISDWFSFYGQTDIPHLLEFGFGGLPWKMKGTFERWSPVEFADDVVTPLLITHGEQDFRVPIAQAEQYYRTLKKLGKEVEFLRFPREGHGIREPRHRLFLDEEQTKWMEKYLSR